MSKKLTMQNSLQHEAELADSVIQWLDDLQEARNALQAIETEKSNRIPESIKKKLEKLNEEYSSQLQYQYGFIQEIETKVKEAVAALQHSVKGSTLHAVYAKPQIRWNNDMLEILEKVYPEIGHAKKTLKCTVSIRTKFNSEKD